MPSVNVTLINIHHSDMGFQFKSRLFGRRRGLRTGEEQTLSEDATFFMRVARDLRYHPQ
jgi:hypothetical protein